ncbi:DEP1 [Candida metapsilosis]|uniref:DEP1 n=1 Tax=Candida metapsilosis TaxID=273372 RepID=A0A8H7ZEI6_9ASCO|nr:DEP1 [Candida metapsilosis]
MQQVETQAVTENKKASEDVSNAVQSTATETKPSPENDDQGDDVIDENTRLTIGKESPLSEIATSPTPFDLSLPESDLDLNVAFLNGKNREAKSTEGDNENHNSAQQNDSNRNKKSSWNTSSEEPNPKTNNEFSFGGVSRQRKDSYESSELSDLGDDESEAETDKMDFLDERDGESLTRPTDLQTLSELTELARMEEIDGDSDEEFTTAPTFTKNEDLPKDKVEDAENNSDKIIRKRTATPANEEEPSIRDAKKLKTEPTSEHETEQDSGAAKEEVERINGNLNGVAEEAKNDAIDPDRSDNTVTQAEAKITHEDEDNEAEAEDEGDDDEEDGENWTSKSQAKLKQTLDAEDEAQDAAEKKVEEAVAEENDTDINEQRELAIKGLISIEKCFAEVRDKLYDDKLALLEKELQLCLDGSHPELSKIYQKINGFYQDSLNLANANLTYRLKCVDKETMATRTSIHQNYLRNIMDTKNSMITETTSMWYKINKERNQLDQIVPDFNYSAIPSSILAQEEATILNPGHVVDAMGTVAPKMKKAIKQSAIIELVQQRNNLNEQLGILNGLVKFHGFPSAVTSTISQEDVATQELLLRKASEEEINEDLRAMGIRT